jgi:hypothetical protein
LKQLALVACAAFLASPAVAGAATIADFYHWKPVFATGPGTPVNAAQLAIEQATGSALPTWSSSIKSPLDGNTYNYTIVGANPQTSTGVTDIKYVPIILVLKFPGGVTLDPRKPGCGDTVSVGKRFFQGPNFKPVALTSNGVSIGSSQIVDGFQRAEFWKYTSGTGYSVPLVAASKTIVVIMNAPSGSATVGGVCSGSSHDIGEININSFDNIVQTIDRKYATPNELPLVLTYNVFETSGGCCILGYHGTYSTGSGTQVYAVGAYNDAGIFSVPIEDIHAWTHEIGEAYNDPYVSNGTPAWGHVGQVGGCQNNLEVGDPLTGTPFNVTFNGFHYHPQELAFFSWFFRQSPSVGTGGKYSFEGTFSTAQGKCT